MTFLKLYCSLLFCIFYFQNNNPELVKEHSHESSLTTVEVAKLKASLKEKGTSSRGRPAQILATKLSGVNDEVRAECGRVESIKRSIRICQRGTLPRNRRPSQSSNWKMSGPRQQDPKDFSFMIVDQRASPA